MKAQLRVARATSLRGGHRFSRTGNACHSARSTSVQPRCPVHLAPCSDCADVAPTSCGDDDGACGGWGSAWAGMDMNDAAKLTRAIRINVIGGTVFLVGAGVTL